MGEQLSRHSDSISLAAVDPAALARADRVYAEVSDGLEAAEEAEPLDVDYLASRIVEELQLDEVSVAVALIRRVIALENTIRRQPELGELITSTEVMLSRAYEIAACSEVLTELDGASVEDHFDPDAFGRALRVRN